MDTAFNSVLPGGYYFVDKSGIKSDEVIKLRQSIGWDDGGSLDKWKKCIEQSLVIVGVRSVNKELVGIAFLAGNLRHVAFCDFIVNSKHQHIGIGGAIMTKIMQTIRDFDINFVYAEFADANPFKEKMLKAGFKVTGRSLFKDPFDD